MLAEVVGELADDVGLDAGFSFGPFGRLFDAVRAAHDVVQEFLVTGCVLFKESHIGFTGFHEFLNHAEHHGAVRARTGRNPFGSKVFARVGGNRIDRIGLRAFGFEGSNVTRTVVKRREPVDVVRDDGIGAPEDDAIGVLDDDVPGGGAGVARANDVGENLGDGRSRIAVLTADEAAAEIQKTLLQIDGGVHLASRHPSVGAAEHGGRAVLAIYALHFGSDEVQGLVPGSADELFGTASFAGLGAVLKVAFAYHGIADARGSVGKLSEPADVRGRRVVVFEGREMRQFAALNMGTEDAPAGGGDDFARVDRGFSKIEGVGEFEVVRGDGMVELSGTTFCSRIVRKFVRSFFLRAGQSRGGDSRRCRGSDEAASVQIDSHESFLPK